MKPNCDILDSVSENNRKIAADQLIAFAWNDNALQSPVFFFFFFSFFCQLYVRLWKGGSRGWVQFFPKYPCKNWYLHLYKIKSDKQVHLQDMTQIRLIKQVLVTLSRPDQVTN